MRDIDERAAEVALEALQLRPHLEAQQCVQRRERLVEEERARVADERPAECYSLPLAARELPGLALEQVLHVQDRRGLLHALLDLVLRQLALLEREGEVPEDGLVRVQREVLEHDRDVTVAGVDVGDPLVVGVDVA